MTAEYRLDIYTPDLIYQATVGDYKSLSFARRVNEPGEIRFALRGDHPAAGYLADKALVKLYRRFISLGITDWYLEHEGIIRDMTWTCPDILTIEVVCRGLLHLLDWRVAAYYAETADRTVFTTTPTETIFKTLVGYNAGSAATVANGRLVEGAMPLLTVEADGSSGSALSVACAYQPLLSFMQQYAGPVGGGDIDIVSGSGYEFRWYEGQLGTDRTDTVRFSLPYGNMASPTYSFKRSAEKTFAIVGGQGSGSSRSIATAYTSACSADNYIEMFVDGRALDSSSLADKGQAQLQKVKARAEIKFDVIQTFGYLYGRDYFLGDRVAWEFAGQSGTVKILGVTGEMKPDGAEVLKFELLDI